MQGAYYRLGAKLLGEVETTGPFGECVLEGESYGWRRHQGNIPWGLWPSAVTCPSSHSSVLFDWLSRRCSVAGVHPLGHGHGLCRQGNDEKRGRLVYIDTKPQLNVFSEYDPEI